MATYIFSCSECDHIDSIKVPMEDRQKTIVCPQCDKESFSYNFGLTMKYSRVYLQEDIVSFMDRKMAKNKLYQGAPSWNKSVAGKTAASAGAGRHFMGDPRFQKKWI
jgi:hypothetical protein